MTRKKVEIYYSIQSIDEGANGETGNPRYLIRLQKRGFVLKLRQIFLLTKNSKNIWTLDLTNR